ncbi:MAG: phosphatidate cytidylyltransferase [Bacteroidales bacterium]|nr:phosphatidate cytidylyltransferase [Bacteroidales bacterium]
MNNLVLRTVTGAIYVVAVIGSIFLGSTVFLLLFFFINALVLREFLLILEKGLKIPLNSTHGIICGSILYLLISLSAMQLIDRQFLLLAAALPAILLIIALFGKTTQPLVKIAIILLAVAYISIPFSLLNLLFANQSIISDGFPWILTGLFIVIWVNDSFSYLTGTFIGKHKLFERISPKKTWEGTMGGFVFSIVSGIIFFYFIGLLELWQWIVMSGLIALFGDFGDLTESMIKRSFNIKDSGSALPGHGGLLDRFDSLLFATPIVVIFLTFIQ